jgi:hypothetical protein
MVYCCTVTNRVMAQFFLSYPEKLGRIHVVRKKLIFVLFVVYIVVLLP